MTTRLGLVINAGQTQQVQASDALGVQPSAGLELISAGALNLGVTATATSIDIGRPTILTTIKGDLRVDGTELVIGNTTFDANVTFGDAATDTVEFVARIKTATNITPIADNSSKLGISGLGWSEIWLRGPDGTTNNLASAASASASGADAIGYFKNSLVDASPNTVQDALDDIYASITAGAAQGLDDVITNSGTHTLDNDVNIPTGNELKFRDNAINLASPLMTLARTGAGATKDILLITGSGSSGWGTGGTIVYGINMTIDPTGGTTTNARGINLTMGAGTGTGITVTQNSSSAQAVLLNNTTGNNNDCLLISGGQLHMNSGAGRFFFEGTSALINATAASEFTTSAGALTITAAAASTWKTSSGALTVDSATALNLGTTDATSVSISKSGVTTTVNGALTVTQTTTCNGDTNLGDNSGDTVNLGGGTSDFVTLKTSLAAPFTTFVAFSGGEGVAMVNDAGTPKVTKADHSATGTLSNAFGIMRNAPGAGGTGDVVLTGPVNVAAARFDSAPVAADVGKRVYGSPTTPGNLTLTAPVTIGQVVQKVGILTSGAATPRVLVQPADSVLL